MRYILIFIHLHSFALKIEGKIPSFLLVRQSMFPRAVYFMIQLLTFTLNIEEKKKSVYKDTYYNGHRQNDASQQRKTESNLFLATFNKMKLKYNVWIRKEIHLWEICLYFVSFFWKVRELTKKKRNPMTYTPTTAICFGC